MMKVEIVGKHPWRGNIGEIIGEENTPAGLAIKIKLIRDDVYDKKEVLVFDKKHLKVLN